MGVRIPFSSCLYTEKEELLEHETYGLLLFREGLEPANILYVTLVPSKI
jgi:hypothetical protein